MNRTTTSMLALLGTLSLSSLALAQPEETADEPETAPAAEAEAVPETPPAEEPPPSAQSGAELEAMEIDTDAEADASLVMEPVTLGDEEASWRIGIAPRIGLAIPTSRLSPFVAFGLELGYRLPALDDRIGVAIDLGYTKPSYDDTVNDMRAGGDAGFEIDESELKFGLGGTFRLFGDDKSLVPWAGAALIMQRLQSTETNDLAPGENTSTDTRFGGELSAGADYELGPGYALGELRMPLTDLNDLITGNSNAGNVNLSLGYRIVL